jgi:hypothetical protein
MSPGMRVKISPEAAPFYRKQATSLEGTVVGLSRSGQIARVHLDEVADSYIRASDLTPAKR